MSEKHDPPNLDLIKMVQQARMLHDESATPSQVPGIYWVEAKRKAGDSPALTPRTGEWRITTTVDKVDALWEQVKAATEAGKLGYKAKVSTGAAHGQVERDARMICVRTYDGDDSADVERVRNVLTEMGFTDLVYVRDSE